VVSKVNTAEINYPDMPACTLVGGEVYDSTGARVAWGPFSAQRQVEAGQPVKVEAGALALRVP
jgi:hypothetical protein